MPKHVFISYSREDREYVQRLAAHIAGTGIPVWYDYELATGDRFGRVIAEKITGSAAFVVVLSPSAVRSDWVDLELGFAKKIGLPICPLMLTSCEPPFLIHNIQYESCLDGTMPGASFVRKLQATLPSSGSAHGPAREGVGGDEEVETIHATAISDARSIGEYYRRRRPLVVNLTEAAEADAKRLVDFMAGMAFIIRGSMERVTSRVFLLVPPGE